jgi:6-phosphogluconolactonase (cycloisomerase 2 family)
MNTIKFTFVAFLAILINKSVMYAQTSDKIIYYSEYGAVGDGVTDDFDAIIRAHAAANTAGLKVRANAGATYYIGPASKSAEIQTDTDWGNARFIIDDSKVDVNNRNRNIFNVSSKLTSTPVTTVKSLRKNQEKLDLSLLHHSFIVATDNTTMRYIREGPNQNNGSAQTDVFVVDKTGLVDRKAPIIWDYNQITTMTAYPIDAEKLTVSGGHFTTIANQAESRYTYYARGIGISRSNVMVDGIHHIVTGELDHGAPYGGFISISNCTEVMVQNCKLSGHRIYVTIGNANVPVSMGSYDISVNSSTNVTFRNCTQYNDIHDPNFWGIMGSNYSKNITLDHVEFSRFDAHMGVANATIRNSLLGHMGINIIGCGVFLVENTKVCGSSFINLRSDYGSTWEGEVVVRNCEYVPRNGAQSDAVLINGSYSGQHDFGYPCFMPEKITIDGLVINDANPPDNYAGPKIFAVFNNDYINEEFKEKYPYAITKEVTIRNMTVKSGKPYLVSANRFMFRNVRITDTKQAIGVESSAKESLQTGGQSSSPTLYMLIGTYTSGTSAGVYVYKFDEETGVASYVSEAKAVNPSYLAVSADERFVYSVGESGRDAAVAYAFAFDKKTGTLSLLNSQPTNGAAPCYISADHTGRFVVTANYSGGNVSVFPLSPDGSLQPAAKVFEFEGSGPITNRQEMPHLHCAVFSPDRRYLFAADLGTDRLHKFTISGTAPFLVTGDPEAYTVEPGSGPRHLTFHPNGKYAYLINELSGQVTAFNYSDGRLEPVQYIAADISEGVGGKGSADIHVSPDGRFLYASNRANTNNIAIFRIGDADGRLTLIGHQPTGRHPRNFIITPNGEYLLVANLNSNLIQVFEIDNETGLLNEDTSKQITTIDRPVCLKFINNF